MAWEGSDRRDRLPPNWNTIRQAALDRAGGRCQATMRNGTRCRDKATEVDHIIRGDNHHPDNLQALCAWHHSRKTSAEGNAARHPVTMRRPPEQHPGLT